MNKIAPLFAVTDKNNLLLNYRIKEIVENGKPKFILQVKLYIWGIWVTVKKICVDVIVEGYGCQYRDYTGRGYSFVTSDGNCRSYEEALEFYNYEPKRKYMSNGFGHYVQEMWANNDIAMNFVSAGNYHTDIGKSRIGIFMTTPTYAYFEPRNSFWEDFFVSRFSMMKMA